MAVESTKTDDVDILVCAPLRQDATLIEQVLVGSGNRLVQTVQPQDLSSHLSDEGSILIITQEGFTRRCKDALLQYLGRQKPWSRLPVIFIVDEAQENRTVQSELEELTVLGDITVLQRPMRTVELTTVVTNALSARQRQHAIRDNLEYQEELQRELNHRVKNTLATFMAIYHMTRRESTDLEEFNDIFERRSRGLIAAHEVLHARAEAGRQLEAIVTSIVGPFAEPNGHATFRGPEIALEPQAGFSMALMLNELVTNAAKYGALANEAGHVDVRWRITGEAEDHLQLEWNETGGPPADEPQKAGYGSRFIEGTAKSLGGTSAFDYSQDGLRFTLRLPLRVVRAGDGK